MQSGSLLQAVQLPHTDMGETLVFLNLQEGKYLGMGGSARVIWELLAQPTTLDAVVDTLTQRYNVSEERCRSDVEAFIQRLIKAGLVTVREPSAP